MPRITLKASQSGKQLIKEARSEKIEQEKQRRIRTQGTIEKGWDMDGIFFIEASKILQPDKTWDHVSANHCAVSLATWKRFREAKQPIDAFTFKAFCQVLELNWEDVVETDEDTNRDLSEAPPPVNFYGRIQELAEFQQSLLRKRYRLILLHGMGGIGKSALVRHLVDRIADKYDRLIWLSLEKAPPFHKTLSRLVQFFSKGEQEEGDISQIIQYLRDKKCLIVLDNWEEIMGNSSEDYNVFVKKIAKESHQSCLLLISRENPDNEILERNLICYRKLSPLAKQDIKEFLDQEGLFGTDINLEYFSKYYNNPWILKRITQSIHNVFNGDISQFINEFPTFFMDKPTNDFLNKQYQTLSPQEINVIHWVAIRRNTALWNQLVQDSQQFLTYQKLFETVDSLIGRHSLMYKNTEEKPVIYILDPVILKYSNELFVEKNRTQIHQVIRQNSIHGSELFITHAFVTENPKDEELNQEQMRRIVKPIAKRLLDNYSSQERLEEQLKKVLSLLENQGLSQGRAYQNISHLISACKQK